LARNARHAQQALGRITAKASEFNKSLDASTARVFAFGATMAVMNSVQSAFANLVIAAKNVESELVKINAVFETSNYTLNKFGDSLFEIARKTGRTFREVASSATEFARQGLSIQETLKRTESAMILTRLSGLELNKSVEVITATLNGFQSAMLNSAQLMNKLAAVDMAFAVSTKDLAEGLFRVGSTAEDANVKFDELMGIITALQQKTARGGAVIGNALKSIFTRLSRSTTIEALQELGVAINNTQDGLTKLRALADALDQISDPGKASKIKELAGGVFQINIVSAALKDLRSEFSLTGRAAAVSAAATDQALQKNAMMAETLEAKVNALRQTFDEFSKNLGNDTIQKTIKGMVESVEGFFSKGNELLKSDFGKMMTKGLSALFSGGDTVAGKAGLGVGTLAVIKVISGLMRGFFAYAGRGVAELMKIGSVSQKIKDLEGQISVILSNNKSLYDQMNSPLLTRVQKEKMLLDYLKAQEASM
jgi:TP901 family phage tail tape measure protein